MLTRIKEFILTTIREETSAERSRRMIPGAFYAGLAAAVFVLTFSIINPLLYPGLRLGFDWMQFISYLVGLGIGLALAGAIVGWFSETYLGIFAGGIILTLLLLLGNLVLSVIANRSMSQAVQVLVISLPLIGPAILLALGIRLAIQRHLTNLQAALEIRRKATRNLVAIVLLVGLIPGIFSAYGLPTRNILTILNESLQHDIEDPALAERFPFDQIPDWKAHYAGQYLLYPHNSAIQTGSLDITIRYKDGFTVTCLVDAASANARHFSYCSAGTEVILP